MKLEYLGNGSYDFTNNAGDRITGTTLYACCPKEGVKGLMAVKISLKKEIALPDGLKSGDSLEVEFDMNGKVISVTKA